MHGACISNINNFYDGGGGEDSYDYKRYVYMKQQQSYTMFVYQATTIINDACTSNSNHIRYLYIVHQTAIIYDTKMMGAAAKIVMIINDMCTSNNINHKQFFYIKHQQ